MMGQFILLLQYEDELEDLTMSSAEVDNKSCLMQQNAYQVGKYYADKSSVLRVALKLMTDICCGFAILNNHNGKQVIIYHDVIHVNSVAIELKRSSLIAIITDLLYDFVGMQIHSMCHSKDMSYLLRCVMKVFVAQCTLHILSYYTMHPFY